MKQRQKRFVACDQEGVNVLERGWHEGHTVACLYWHLRERNMCGSFRTMQRHMEPYLTGKPYQRGYRLERDPFPPTAMAGSRFVNEMPLIDPVTRECGVLGAWKYVPTAASGTKVRDGERPELVLIRGAVGSGKSELARTLTATHVHIEADQFFWSEEADLRLAREVRDGGQFWAVEMTRLVLRSGRNVVVANTFARNEWMLPYYEVAVALDLKVRVYKTASEEYFKIANTWYWIDPLRFHNVVRVRNEGIGTIEKMGTQPSAEYTCQPFSCAVGTGAALEEMSGLMVEAVSRVYDESYARSVDDLLGGVDYVRFAPMAGLLPGLTYFHQIPRMPNTVYKS